MKKIALTLVLLVCAFTLAACDQDAYELFMDMGAAMEGITSSQSEASMQITMEAAGETVNMDTSMDIKQIIRSETDIEMEMRMSVDMGELGTMDASMYFQDSTMYYDMMGMKMKMEVPLEEAMQIAGGSAMDMTSLVSEDAITASSVTEAGSDKELRFTLRGDLLSDALAGMMGQMTQTMGAGDIDLAFGDVEYTVLVGPDNLPKEERVVFTMDTEIQGEAISAAYDMTMKTTGYNNVDAIDFPSDLDSYTDMPADMGMPAA